MALSTPESDVELARRQREGVFVPPPHWKPRQEEVDLKKDYAFKRAQREGERELVAGPRSPRQLR